MMSRQICAAAAFVLAGTAHAAGGHHAVDDAALLATGQCEAEAWFSHARGAGHLLHAGGSCRVGPVQLGGASEHVRSSGFPSETAWGLEAKWAQALGERFAVGALLQPAWQAHVRPRYQGVALIGLATWTPREDLAVHLNLGRDFVHGDRDRNRGGIALEWSPVARWTLLAERYLEQDTHLARAGVRWQAGESWSVDFSRAQRISGPGPSTWTLGFTRVFGD